MNPSTNDILEAVLATPAKTVMVLPNNKNIIMAAEQTVPLVKDRKVIVLPTRTIPQGLSAMLAYDPDVSTEQNAVTMMEAAGNVATGTVRSRRAIRNITGIRFTRETSSACATAKWNWWRRTSSTHAAN